MKICFVIFLLLVASGCNVKNEGENMSTYIGEAHMESDRTIVLTLDAKTGETAGHSMFRYAPDDPQYNQIVEHVGQLKPGETVLVRPW